MAYSFIRFLGKKKEEWALAITGYIVSIPMLIIFLIWRRTFNGPVDGVVYACVVAAGFAFAENILYFVKY